MKKNNKFENIVDEDDVISFSRGGFGVYTSDAYYIKNK